MHDGVGERPGGKKPEQMLVTLTFCIFQFSVDTNLHVNELMEAAKAPNCTSEDGLLGVPPETVQQLEGVQHCRNRHNATADGRRASREKVQRGREGGVLSTAEDEQEDEIRGRNDDEEEEGEEGEERGCKSRALGVLRDLRVFHSGKLRDWKEALRECASMLNGAPPGGGDQPCPSEAGTRFYLLSELVRIFKTARQ